MPAREWTAWERGVATALLDARGDLVEMNPALQRQLQGRPRSLRDLIHPDDWPGLEGGQVRVRLQPGLVRFELSLTPLEEGWLAQFFPCTRGADPRDFYHRAKNHLAVISSLLHMQSNLMEEELVKRAFGDCQMRVHCLALLYSQVHPETGRLDFAAHLRQMLEMLLEGRTPHKLDTRLQSVDLSIDQAVPLSLIAHELIGNSLRHAWGSWLEISLEGKAHERVRFMVADNGPGLPPEVEASNARSLGFRLVRTLSRQIRAEVAWGTRGGMRCSLTFVPKEKG